MEKRTYALFIGISLFVFFVSATRVFAYSVETHAFLTDAVFDFHNKYADTDKKLSEHLRSFLIDGSRREDDFPRWMNHFYDPVHDRGLTHDAAIDPLISVGTWQKSKEWTRDEENQNKSTYKVPATIASILTAIQQQSITALSIETNFTWQQAIRHWLTGKKEKAMFMLGHVLHLVQDTAVPDHTRNDAHPPTDPSPYEEWTSQFVFGSDRNNLDRSLNTKSLITFGTLDSYFDAMAQYSNNNFYSKDTFGASGGYKNPQPEFYPKRVNGINFAFQERSIDGDEHLLFMIKNYQQGDDIFILPSSAITLSDPLRLVMKDYWSRLSTKAVQYSAGVIDLFFREVARAEQDPSFLGEEPKSTLASALDAVQSFFTSAASTVTNVANDVATFTQNIISKIQNNPESIEEIVTETAEQIENLLAGDPTDGVVIDTEEERAQLKELQNQLDDIADQIDDLTYQVDVATGKGGAPEKTDGADGETDDTDGDTNDADDADASSGKDVNISSKKNKNSSNISSSGGGVAASAPNLLITEIMYNASGTDDGREWIEIRNDGTSVASLDDVRFLEGGTNHRLTFARGSASLTSGTYAVIADDSEKFLLDYPSFAGSIFDSSFSLSNDGETLALTFNGSAFHSISYASSTGGHGDGNSLQLISGTWQASTPTPGMVNVLSSSGGGSSSGGSATSTATSSAPTSGFGAWHVVISEVQTAGADAGDEFIELYNPTDAAVDMSTWSLQYAGASTAVTSSTVSKKNFLATSSIAAKSFYLVGRGLNEGADGYRGSTVADMAHRTFSLSGATAGARIFLVASTTPIENETDAIILDALDYTSTTVPDAGQGLERKAWSSNLCHSAIAGGTGEFLGSACDTGAVADDFEIRLASNPQNRASFKEPRAAPTAPLAATGSTAFAVYDRNAVAINFAWQASADFQGATSTVSYRMTNASTSANIFTGTSTSFSYTITEVGRSYSFVLQAFDRDGMGSATSSVTVAAPSFLDFIRWYRDPRASSTSYLLDLSYSIYPFVPQKTSSGNSWRLPIFYKNRDVLQETLLNLGEPATIPSNVIASALTLLFKDCAGVTSRVSQFPVFPDTAAQCLASGPSANDVSFSLLEDPYMRFTLASSTAELLLSPDDYVMVAFYDFYPFSVPRTFSFVAADMSRYRFSSTTPSLAVPVLPDALQTEFDATSSRLILRWATSTDTDTLDDLITYHINFSTSTALDGVGWVSVEPQPRADLDDQTTISLRSLRHVVPSDSFTIGLRAADEFGATSTARMVAWAYPSAAETFSQSTSTGWSDQWGMKNPPCPSCPPRASLQSIVPTSTLVFDLATVRVWEEAIGRNVMTTLRLAVFEDDGSNKPLLTSKLGEATLDQLGDLATSTDLAFTFSAPLTLATSTKYWFALDVGSVSDNNAYYENTWKNAVATGDPYPAGQAGRGANAACPNNDHCGTTIPSPSADADWYLKLYLRQ